MYVAFQEINFVHHLGADMAMFDELQIASDSSVYKKLVSSSEHDYTYWAPKCGGEMFIKKSLISYIDLN